MFVRRTVAEQASGLVGLGPEALALGRVVWGAERRQRDEELVDVLGVGNLPAVRARDPGRRGHMGEIERPECSDVGSRTDMHAASTTNTAAPPTPAVVPAADGVRQQMDLAAGVARLGLGDRRLRGVEVEAQRALGLERPGPVVLGGDGLRDLEPVEAPQVQRDGRVAPGVELGHQLCN